MPIDNNLSVSVLGLYLLALVVLGWIGYRRGANDEEDYFLAGRTQNWWVTSISIMATFFSAFALLGAPGMVYREGVAFALFSLNLPIAGLAIYALGSRIWRIGKTFGYITPADLICGYYGGQKTLRLLVSLTAFLWVIPYIMMQFQAGGLVWSRLFPGMYAFEQGTILLAAITAIYVLVGGMRSIAWSDVLQGLLLMGGMLLGGIAILTLTGGPANFGRKLMELPASSLTLPGNSGTWHWSKMMTVVLFAALAGILQPAQWMRLYSSRNREALRKSALCFAICLPPCFLLGTMLVGLGGQVLYPLEWTESGHFQASAAVGSYDEIFVVILRDVLPSVLGSFGILLGAITLVAIMAASMSTADSSLHALSAVTVRDIYKSIFRPESGERESINVGRFVIVLASGLAVFLVLRGKHLERVGDTSEILQMLVALGLVAVAFTSQLLPMTVDILFIRRGTSLGAIVGLTLGLAGAFAFGPLLGSLATASEPWDRWNLIQSLLKNIEILKTAIPIDASAWGLLFNTLGFTGVSYFSKPVPEETRNAFSDLVN